MSYFSLPKIEKKILKFWRENRIFEKSIELRTKYKDFIFYEGPPTANGKTGIHHILSRAYKDIVLRYKTMQKFKVLRKAGWDTHGLPVELEVEKKLGLKNKKDIEKYGIAKFNKKCKQSVWTYKDDWEKLTQRIGFWLDIKNPYITYQPEYIETVWQILKQIYQKKLLYQDYKVVPYCTRCGTSLSSHEVAQGYKKVKETSVYIKFKILSKDKKWENTSILSWTTTPWTLPGNVALAINPKFTYVKIKIKNEIFILAKERLKILSGDYKVLEEIKGKDLLGLEYKPLFKIAQLKSKTSYKIYPADFVTTEEGTGIVHTAVMYGEDDYNLGKKFNIPNYHTVTEKGRFIKNIGEGLADKYVKDKETEFLILTYLKKKNLLFAEELYEHDYPFCWRCKTPLLYYAKKSWFIRMTKVKKNLIENNQKINWFPSHLKNGRFGEWLREIKDWVITRERYWGTPFPIWQCEKCNHQEVIGSKKDLLAQKFTKNKYFILRHGESLRNIKDIAVCWPEKLYCPLTKKGEKQIREVGQKLKREKIDLIFSSDLLRTRQTAEIIGKKLGIKPKLDKKLREINVGVLNGKPIKEIGKFWDKEKKLLPLEYYSKRFQIALPKGETYIAVEKRMSKFIKEINEKYQGKNILIVSHQRPFTLLEKVIYDYDLKKFVEIITRKKEIKTGELRKLEFKKLPYNEKMELDFHRPYIDEVKFYCPKCGKGLMKRVPEVIDCWFDSGSMPFAQSHWSFASQKLRPPKLFPADFICEAIDQTRGWFYTLLAISTLLGFGSSYKNVISLGHVLDKKGEKMSKSKGNIVDPWFICNKYGADAVRWYFFTVNRPGDSKLFEEKNVEQALKRFILTLWHSYTFYSTYAPKKKASISKPLDFKHFLDKWIISKLHGLIQKTTNDLDNYDITSAARSIESFVIDDLSNWYIRRSRQRFQKPKTKEELNNASRTLGYVLFELSLLSAPFIPFLSEEIYKNLVQELSVHLTNWPESDKKLINKSLNQKMVKVREIASLSLAERAKVGIKVRQPLASLQIPELNIQIPNQLLNLIKEEVNVKEITFGKVLKLNIKITQELKEEGIIREVVRQIQEMRKKAGYKSRHRISVRYSGTPNLNEILSKNKDFIQKEAKVKNFQIGDMPKRVFDIEREIKVDGQILWLGIKKI